MLATTNRATFTEDHVLFREQVRRFMAREAVPNLDRWERAGVVDRSFWNACGDAGLLCPGVAEAYGGPGLDFTFNAIVAEELAYIGCNAGITLQSDITCGYIESYGSEAARQRWLPPMLRGEVVTAIAMTEPGTGSDLKALRTTVRRDGDEYIVSGAKTYITNGQSADLVIVAGASETGLSLVLVEADRPGFARGRNLDKIGQHAADTSELFFDAVRVPASNLLGEEGQGFGYLVRKLPQERLSIAVSSQAGAQRAFDEAVAFTKDRKAFGKPVFDFQNTRFTLAALAVRLQVGWAHLDWAIARHCRGELTASEAAAAKLFHTELLWDCCDQSLQLHGGAGYMNEQPIARLWRDARVARIYGGTSEIMLEVIGRSL
jgi:alkylation response protein AidB-like acyl-CoA dehydrogenase